MAVLANILNTGDRIGKIHTKIPIFYLKKHKRNFSHNTLFRLINPTKSGVCIIFFKYN